MVNPIKSFKNSLSQIPTKYRYLSSLGILAALLIALPVTLIGLTTGTFELRERAASVEVTPTPTPTIALRKCPGTCLPNFLCRFLGGKCVSGFTCARSGYEVFSNCCCLRSR